MKIKSIFWFFRPFRCRMDLCEDEIEKIKTMVDEDYEDNLFVDEVKRVECPKKKSQEKKK